MKLVDPPDKDLRRRAVLRPRRAQIARAKALRRGRPVGTIVVVGGQIDQFHRGTIRVGKGRAAIIFDAVHLAALGIGQNDLVGPIGQRDAAILIIDRNPAIGGRISIAPQHQKRTRRDQQRAAVVDHMDIGIIVRDGVAVEINRAVTGVEDLEILARVVRDSRRVLHDLGDDKLRQRHEIVVEPARVLIRDRPALTLLGPLQRCTNGRAAALVHTDIGRGDAGCGAFGRGQRALVTQQFDKPAIVRQGDAVRSAVLNAVHGHLDEVIVETTLAARGCIRQAAAVINGAVIAVEFQQEAGDVLPRADPHFDELADISARVVIMDLVDPRVDLCDIGNRHSNIGGGGHIPVAHTDLHVIDIVAPRIRGRFEIGGRDEAERAGHRINRKQRGVGPAGDRKAEHIAIDVTGQNIRRNGNAVLVDGDRGKGRQDRGIVGAQYGDCHLGFGHAAATVIDRIGKAVGSCLAIVEMVKDRAGIIHHLITVDPNRGPSLGIGRNRRDRDGIPVEIPVIRQKVRHRDTGCAIFAHRCAVVARDDRIVAPVDKDRQVISREIERLNPGEPVVASIGHRGGDARDRCCAPEPAAAHGNLVVVNAALIDRRVKPTPAAQKIIARTSGKRVVAPVPMERVLSCSAIKDVIARTGKEQIIAATARQDVIPAKPEQDIPLVRSVENIGFLSAKSKVAPPSGHADSSDCIK